MYKRLEKIFTLKTLKCLCPPGKGICSHLEILKSRLYTISYYSQSQLYPHMLSRKHPPCWHIYFFLFFWEICLTIGIRGKGTSNQATGTIFSTRGYLSFKLKSCWAAAHEMSGAHTCLGFCCALKSVTFWRNAQWSGSDNKHVKNVLLQLSGWLSSASGTISAGLNCVSYSHFHTSLQ